MYSCSMRNDSQILHVDQTRCWEILRGRPRMLMREFFVVANFLVYFAHVVSGLHR